MEKNKESKKVGIKNCMSYQFDDIIKFEDFDFNSNFLNEKSYENHIYDISYKILFGVKPMCILFY